MTEYTKGFDYETAADHWTERDRNSSHHLKTKGLPAGSTLRQSGRSYDTCQSGYFFLTIYIARNIIEQKVIRLRLEVDYGTGI